MKVDYMIYVRLVIGVGLLLAGGVSVILDHSPSQIVLSSMGIVLGILFVLMALFPKGTGVKDEILDKKEKADQAWEKINLQEEEKIHLDNIEVNDESVKKYLEDSKE